MSKHQNLQKKSLGGNFFMVQQEIFKGLNLTLGIARDLAIYHRVADGVIGVINENGHLHTAKNKTWRRPMANKSFKVLKEALSGDLVIVGDNYIFVDFPALAYNLNWVRELIRAESLGVMESKEGLMLFKKNESKNMPLWYEQSYWTLKGVKVEALNLELKKKVVSLSANPENPDDANWATLYFVA